MAQGGNAARKTVANQGIGNQFARTSKIMGGKQRGTNDINDLFEDLKMKDAVDPEELMHRAAMEAW